MDSIISFLLSHWILSTAFVVLGILFLINEWRNRAFGMKGVSSQELVNLINHSGAVLIDVRTTERFSKAHILGAQNIPEKDFANRLNALNKYKSKPLVFVCDKGIEATRLSTLLIKGGFSQLYYLTGGMSGWQADGMPVVNK